MVRNLSKSDSNLINSYEISDFFFSLYDASNPIYFGNVFTPENNFNLDKVSFYLEKGTETDSDLYAQIYNSKINDVEQLQSYNNATYSSGISGDTDYSMAFTLSKPIKLSKIEIPIFKTSTIGDIYAKIYAITGVIGTNALPTGSALATSDAFDASVLSGSSPVSGYSTLTFSGDQQITLDSGNYCIVLSGLNFVVGWDQSNASATGYVGYSDDNGSSWTGYTGKFRYNLYGIDESLLIPDGDPIAISEVVNTEDFNQAITTYNYKIASEPVENWSSDIKMSSAHEMKIGDVFTSSYVFTLKKCNFVLSKTGSPTGNLVVKLYTAFNDNTINELVATSDNFDVSTLSEFGTETEIAFSGDNQIGIIGTKYAFVIEYSGGDISNYVNVGINGSSTSDTFIFFNGDTPIYQKPTDYYSETNYSATQIISLTGASQYRGQSFTNSYENTLDKCSFYVMRNGSPTGNVYAKLYAHTGTYGTTSGKPTGSALATSDAIDITTITNTSSPIIKDFVFSGENKIKLDANTYYCIELNYEGVSGNDGVYVGIDNSSPTHSGIANTSNNGSTWSAISGVDVIFYVYGTRRAIFNFIGETTTYHGDLELVSSTTQNNYEWIDFNFIDENISITKNNNYFIIIKSENSPAIISIGLSDLPSGNEVLSYDGTNWTPNDGLCINYKVYGLSIWSNEDKSSLQF